MANNDTSIQVAIQANVKDLQKGLSKAEGRLKQFDKVAGQTTKQTAKFGKTVSANAVPAMTSFSQVIQDAPFGIRGVANNITQLTAQFGHLQKRTGGAKAALKSMLSTLAGPAGILLAISAITSLLVSYGDEITAFIFGTDKATNATEKLNDALREQAELRKLLKDELNLASSIAVAEAKLAGKNLAEQFAVRKKFAEANIEILKTQANEQLKTMRKFHDANQVVMAKGSEEEIKAYEDLKKERLQIQKALNDAIGRLRLDELNEQIRVQELAKESAVNSATEISKAVKGAIGLSAIPAEGINNTILNAIPTAEAFTEKAVKLKEAAIAFNKSFGGIIKEGMTNALVGIGEAIGDALTGGTNILKGAASALLGALGDMMVKLGKMAIGIGIGIQKIKAALLTLNPALAIGAGIALVALGTIFKKGAANIAGGGSGSRGGGGGDLSTDFSRSSQGASSFGGSSVSGGDFRGGNVVFEIAGTKLVGVLSNTLNKNKALGGNNTLALT